MDVIWESRLNSLRPDGHMSLAAPPLPLWLRCSDALAVYWQSGGDGDLSTRQGGKGDDHAPLA
ncbi:hypothetical protein EYF80_060286 [Liparis tanakae]|uniref:Uncharacterized protein n=1 Tax=Liparis tanakae TaxID=230148 RepID=A0A4Z2ELF5_9TELE|nr:hypothetical protein EYF80_060286 [Liparis tanakae]